MILPQALMTSQEKPSNDVYLKDFGPMALLSLFIGKGFKSINHFWGTDFLNCSWGPHCLEENGKGNVWAAAFRLWHGSLTRAGNVENSGPELKVPSLPSSAFNYHSPLYLSSSIRNCYLWYFRRLNSSKTFPKSLHASQQKGTLDEGCSERLL